MNPRRLLLVAAVAGALVLRGAGGQAPSKIVDHGAAPAVSPDGARIAFLSDRDGATEVYVIGADGTGEDPLDAHAGSGEPARVVRRRQTDLVHRLRERLQRDLCDRGKRGRAQGGSAPSPAGPSRLSPDGKRVLYWVGTWTAMKLFVSDLDGSGAQALTDGTGVVWGARWSPDGKRIAFADKDASQLLQIHVMNADGSGRRQVTRFASADGSAQMPAWSRDGAKLAVQSGAKGIPAHVWIVDASSGSAQKLGAHTEPYVDEVPTWFPDGKHIAFQSNRSGAMEIWVMGSDGSAPRQVTR